MRDEPVPDELTRLLLRLMPVLVRHQIVMARHLGLEAVEYLCLEILDRHGAVPVRMLAERTGLSSSTATRLVDRLEEAGHVERRPNPDDHRSVLVERRANPEWERARRGAIAPLDRALRALLPAGDDRRRTLVAAWVADATDAVHRATREREHTDRGNELARAQADRRARDADGRSVDDR